MTALDLRGRNVQQETFMNVHWYSRTEIWWHKVWSAHIIFLKVVDLQWLFVLTINDNQVSYRLTLFIFGRPGHISSFKLWSGDPVSLWKQLVYSVTAKNKHFQVLNFFFFENFFLGVADRVLLAYVWQRNCGIPGRKRGSNGGSIPTEPPLCCFIPRGLIHWMCKDDGVTIGDQMGLTTGWKCEECLLNWCSRDDESGAGLCRDGSRGCLGDVHNGH